MTDKTRPVYIKTVHHKSSADSAVDAGGIDTGYELDLIPEFRPKVDEADDPDQIRVGLGDRVIP